MAAYIAKRIFYMIVAFFCVSLVTFFLMKSAPGSFLQLTQANVGGESAALQFGSQGITSPAVMQQFINTFHLNQPWYMQYWGYVWGFISLHLGSSFEYQSTPTIQLIGKTFPTTLEIALLSIGLAIILSLILGVISALRANTWVDRSTMLIAMFGTAVPHYVVAVVLILIFGVWLRVLPVMGWSGPQNWIMPVLAMALPMCGSMSRYMRNSLIETLNSEFMVTVYAKGGTWKNALFGHGLRNSLLPFITVVGPQLAGLLMGTVYIEQMFGILAMGKVFTGAAGTRDYPLIMDSTLLYAVFVMAMNLVVDLCYGLLDPRIRKSVYSGR